MNNKSLFHNAVTELKLRRLASKEHKAWSHMITPPSTFLTYVTDIAVGMILGALLLIGLFA